MALGTTLGAMNTFMFRPRYLCLALLATAVIHGHLQAAHAGAAPGSTGLTRLSRDLMRLAGSENPVLGSNGCAGGRPGFAPTADT